MKIFNILLKLGNDTGLSDPESEKELIAKIDAWEKGSKKEDATKLQILYDKIHRDPLLEVCAPLIYIWLKSVFNNILNPELKEEYSRDTRY